ncbi:MAG: serine/threonine-protein phosphatase [Ruminococcus sp.]|nr:serine/threonine-protein phosphatase [Ruminococcus sp.]
MSRKIGYAFLCKKGKVRSKNQDNYWCMGDFLPQINEGLQRTITGEIKLKETKGAFCVFDGMGGEAAGEVASSISATTFNNIYKSVLDLDFQSIADMCYIMNRNVCRFAQRHNIQCMGTTAAMLLFEQKSVYACNLGDSQIFLLRGNKLQKISVDHVALGTIFKKPPLTQHLGIPKDEFKIDPYIVSFKIKKGDRFLICSDGLTDMLEQDDIEAFLFETHNIEDCVNDMMELVYARGAVDNTTIVLCEVR